MYLGFRLVEREKVLRSADAAILLDADECVTESESSALILNIGGQLVVPGRPHTALDSITRRIVLDLARSLGITVTARPVHRTELATASILLAGTLFGVRPVEELDGRQVPRSTGAGLLDKLCQDYSAFCRGKHQLSDHYLTHV